MIWLIAFAILILLVSSIAYNIFETKIFLVYVAGTVLCLLTAYKAAKIGLASHERTIGQATGFRRKNVTVFADGMHFYFIFFVLLYFLFGVGLLLVRFFYSQMLIEALAGFGGGAVLIYLTHLYTPSGYEPSKTHELHFKGGGYFGKARRKDAIEHETKLTWEEYIGRWRVFVQAVFLLATLTLLYFYYPSKAAMISVSSAFAIYWFLRWKIKWD